MPTPVGVGTTGRHNEAMPPVPAWISRLELAMQTPGSNVEEALLVDYPVETGLSRQEWRHGLLREYQLITHGAHDQHELELHIPRRLLALADQITERYGRLIEQHTAELERALAAGTDRIVLRYPLQPGAVTMEIEFAKAMEESDAYCRGQALMTLEPSPVSYQLRRWVVEELTRQHHGEPPRAWPEFLRELDSQRE